ncbi:MAG: pilus assembly FimT family protein [Verrucomicrobiales bacterium]
MTVQTPKTKALPAFSLVELLAVVAIVGIMLSLAAVSFSSSDQRAGVVSRDLIMAQLQRARSHAIATGVPTAVVFAPYTAGPEESRARMMGLVEVSEGEDAATPYVSERILTRWEELPQPMKFVGQGETGRGVATVMDGTASLRVKLGGQELSAPYLVFSREGTVLYPRGLKVEIGVAPAIIEGGNPRLIGQGQEGGASVEIIEVSRLTGRVKHVEKLAP